MRSLPCDFKHMGEGGGGRGEGGGVIPYKKDGVACQEILKNFFHPEEVPNYGFLLDNN